MINMQTPTSSCMTSETQGEGLKFIASSVQKVLMAKKVVSYDELLSNINAKNRSTLRRRVYDVLSVMRALNIVKKEDKHYVVSAHTHVVELNDRINEKRRRLDDLVGIKTALMYLIKRNMAMTKWVGGVREMNCRYKNDNKSGDYKKYKNSGYEKENRSNYNYDKNTEYFNNNSYSQGDYNKTYRNYVENSNIFTLPFLVVMAKKSSNVHCETDEERKFFRFKCTSRLIILDDLKILKIIYDEKENHRDNYDSKKACFQKQSDSLDFFI
ncbi:Transcription factor dpl-1 [Dictyocoela muelleri]|nr:Transcription factor dpl-1 [Dictyocoela muelleri]